MLVPGGVRGGISIALSIPDGPHKPAIVMATYVVVLFSVLVQSSSVSVAAKAAIASASHSSFLCDFT